MNKPREIPPPATPCDKAGERWKRNTPRRSATTPGRNRSGIAIEPLYTPQDWDGAHTPNSGIPGQPPYTRGIYATMHRGRTWTPAPADRPRHAARLQRAPARIISQGATAVSLIPCNSVFRGYDMDEVHVELLGTCGMVVNTASTWTVRSPASTSRAPPAR